jgi:hypothetical protein
MGIQLIVINDEDAAKLKTAFRDYDSIGVFDEKFVIWRYHSGQIAWSENWVYTSKWRRRLNKLCILRSEGGNVLRIIRGLARSLR